MDKNQFIKQLQDQFEEPVLLDFDSDFKSLDNYDSIVALSIISMVDDEYNVSVDGNDMKKIRSVGELYNLVKSRV